MNFKFVFLKRPKYCPDSESDRDFGRKRHKTPRKSEKLESIFCLKYNFVGTYSNCAEINPVHEYVAIFSIGCRKCHQTPKSCKAE